MALTGFKIDHVAREIALRRFVLPECLHVPIAALNEDTIASYIGNIVQVLAGGIPKKALMVRVKEPPPIDPRLPIWGLNEASIFFRRTQVWVHVAYSRYRSAYKRAFPTEQLAGKVLSHCMNRRIAVLKGFQYVRITPVSRGANSSSRFSEDWGVKLHAAPGRTPDQARRGALIQYADLCDLMLMMDLQLGGGVMDIVNEGHKLVKFPVEDQDPWPTVYADY